MKLFLDTNVLIDFISERKNELKGIDYYSDAATLMSLASVGEIEVYVSSLTIVNAWYICVERIKIPMLDVREKLDAMKGYLGITSVTADDIYSAYGSGWDDFEDAVQHSSAKRAGCGYIVTRNEDDFCRSELTVMSPVDMTEMLYEMRQKNTKTI